MAHYVLAIDETGEFLTSPFYTLSKNKRKSFACGVCFIDKSEQDIKDVFSGLHHAFFGVAPISNDIKDILGEKNKNFHSKNLDSSKLSFCKDAFMPFIDNIFCSDGLPSLYANNQDWWLTSIVVTIELFLDNYDFKDFDDITIMFDERKDSIWGVLDQNTAPYTPQNFDKNNPNIGQKKIFDGYHHFLIGQIYKYLDPMIKHRNIDGRINIRFGGDSRNPEIAVADLAAKWITNGLIPKTRYKSRQCKEISNYKSPEHLFQNQQYVESFSTILHELENKNTKHVSMVSNILNALETSDDYSILWSLFYDFIKNRIDYRSLDVSKTLVEVFTRELKNILPVWNDRIELKELSCTDFIILINEYSSHAGAISMPFSADEFEKSNETENRILRRWENNIRFYLRAAQICFNGYDFKTISKEMASLWNKQKQVIKLLGEGNDSHSSSMIGTLGQAYAFLGDDATAEIIFNEGLSTSNSKKEQTYSYLFTIYHKKRDVKRCYELFKLSSGFEAKDYLSQWENDRSKKFNLVSYEKLRALELKTNGKTELPRFDIENHKELKSEYPVPLIKKWSAISLYLDNKDKNKNLIKDLLCEATIDLMKANGFAERSLALPIIQCASLVGFRGDQYVELFNALTKESDGFANYAKSTPGIETLDNDLDIWDRALLLPFYYA